MTNCRCGHGRGTHRTSDNASRKRRALGLRPTGHLPCTAYVQKVLPDGRRVWGASAKRCTCRNWHPQEVQR